ncbi:murein biosynthesis integral membrane protein MurJ [Caballeronia sp. RCC_10]|uniref:murein biosynthesis integral membrane protein MurJ n=1 Tax=Caballeronia sp. RCC_10 TaxID=3239227 RepID=UPI003524A67D
MVIAYRYGTGNVVDAYQIALTLVSWLPGACSAVFAIILVPLFVDLRKDSSSEESSFLGELLGWSLLVGLALTFMIYVGSRLALNIMASQLALATRDMAHHMMLVMAPVGVLIMVENAYSTRLQSRERHIVTLLDSLPAVMTLLLVLLISVGNAMVPLMYGAVLGYAAMVALLSPLAGKVNGRYSRPSLTFNSRHWRPTFRAVRVFMWGQLVVCCTPALDQYFAARFGDGAIATLGYANRLFGLIASMGALAIAQGTLPVLSDIVGRDVAKGRRTAIQWSVLMLGAGTLCALVIYPLAPWMVQVVYQRGAFTAANTAVVADLIRCSLLQLPFYFASLVMMNLLAVEKRYKGMAIVTALGFLVKLGGNVALVHWLGMPGILVATGVMHAAIVCLSTVTVWRARPE